MKRRDEIRDLLRDLHPCERLDIGGLIFFWLSMNELSPVPLLNHIYSQPFNISQDVSTALQQLDIRTKSEALSIVQIITTLEQS
jgi:hypothetical protein